jgi:hypothetical protein
VFVDFHAYPQHPSCIKALSVRALLQSECSTTLTRLPVRLVPLEVMRRRMSHGARPALRQSCNNGGGAGSAMKRLRGVSAWRGSLADDREQALSSLSPVNENAIRIAGSPRWPVPASQSQ